MFVLEFFAEVFIARYCLTNLQYRSFIYTKCYIHTTW